MSQSLSLRPILGGLGAVAHRCLLMHQAMKRAPEIVHFPIEAALDKGLLDDVWCECLARNECTRTEKKKEEEEEQQQQHSSWCIRIFQKYYPTSKTGNLDLSMHPRDKYNAHGSSICLAVVQECVCNYRTSSTI